MQVPDPIRQNPHVPGISSSPAPSSSQASGAEAIDALIDAQSHQSTIDARQIHLHQHLPRARSVTACPECQSEDTARARAIYEAGTTHWNVAMGTMSGDIGIGSGQAMSIQAARCAPPEKQKSHGTVGVIIGLLIIGVGIVVACESGPPDNYAIWQEAQRTHTSEAQARAELSPGAGTFMAMAYFSVAGLIFIGMGIRGLVRAHHFNRDHWMPRFVEWSEMVWMCRRCGKRFKAMKPLPGENRKMLPR